MSHSARGYGGTDEPLYAWVSEDEALRGVVGRRVFAFLLDSVLLAVILGVVWLAFALFTLMTFGLGAPVFGLLPAAPLLYGWLFVASPLSATPGQTMMGLVVRRNEDLGDPGSLAALVWAAGYVVTMALGAFLFVVALLTERNRALHDIVSGLVVVRARALTSPPGFWNMPRGGID